MRTIRILLTALVAVATLGFASCSSDNDAPRVKEGEKAFLSIKIANAETRAAGTVTDNADNAINNFVAFAFKNDGSIDGEMLEVSGTTSGKHTMHVSNATTKVAVVANVDADKFSAVTNKTTFDAVKEDLEKLAYRTGGVEEANVWASAIENVTFTKTSEGLYTSDVDVNLAFAVARINFTVDATNYINQDKGTAFKIQGVAALNAKKESKFFGSLLTEGVDNFYSGWNMTGYANEPAGKFTVVNFLKDDITAGTGVTTESFHYYVTENKVDAVDKFPTILALLLKGKDADGNDQEIYQTLHFASYDGGNLDAKAAQVTRGKSYDVKFTLTGNADPNGTPGDGTDEPGGTEDPTLPSSADLNITVKVATWDPVTINKDF